MATWTPVEGLVPQETQDGGQAAGMVLKFYEPGTTTPLTMATDNTGGTTTTNFLLDSQGRTTNGGTICVPHTSTAYKAILYLNQTDADADATGSAVYTVNDIDTFEPALGVPGTTGFVLSSTTAGVRSWVAASGDSLGNPPVDGQVLASTSAGVRSWVDNGSLPSWNLGESVGSAFSATYGSVGLTSISNNQIALCDATTRNLQAYEYDDEAGTWSALGSALAIGGTGSVQICALSNTQVALVIGTPNNTLQMYEFDGSTWTTLGSTYSVTTSVPAIKAINSTDIVFANNSSNTLTVYRFGGSAWTQIDQLAVAGFSGASGLCVLNSTDFIFAPVSGSGYIQAYTFNGSTISSKGSPIARATISAVCCEALNSTDFIVCDANTFSSNLGLQIYRFDGLSITTVTNIFPNTSGKKKSTWLNGNHVVFLTATEFQLYKFNFSIGTPYNQSLLV